MTTNILTAERLRELFHYNSETGAFTRLKPQGHAKAGDIAGYLMPIGYRGISVDGGKYYEHRLAFLYVYGTWPIGEIDHVNGARADNRFSNLRNATRSENQQNLRNANTNNLSGYLGVSRCAEEGKWRASITLNYKWTHIGYFDCPVKAHEAYLAAKRQLHTTCTI